MKILFGILAVCCLLSISCNDPSPVAPAQTTGGFGSTTVHFVDITVGQ